MAFSFDGSTIALYKADETVAGGYATAVDSAAFGGTARDLTEFTGLTPGFSPLWPQILNGHNGSSGYARWFPGTVAAGLSRAADASIYNALTTTTGAYTIEAWVRIDSFTAARTFLCVTGPVASETAANNLITQFYVQTTGRLGVFWEQGAGGNVSFNCTTGTVMTTGTWYHVAITVDNSGASSSAKFYINGSLQQTSGALTKATGGTTSTIIVGAGDLASNPMHGTIDDLVLTNDLRTDPEIAADAAAATHTIDGNTLLCYRFNEAPDLKDESTYGYHLRRVIGSFDAVDPLITGSTKARHFAATEYNGHPDYELFRNTMENSAWTFECWFVLDSLHQVSDRGLWVYGDTTQPALLANNAVGLNLLSVLDGVPAIEGGVLSFFGQRAAGVSEDVVWESPNKLLHTGTEYDRHYLAVTHSLVGSGHVYTYYVDGEIKFIVDRSVGFAGGTGANNYLRLGASSEPGAHFFQGILDDIRWSSIVRDSSEIEATWAGRGDYTPATPTFPVSWPMDADTIAFYKFNEVTTPVSHYADPQDSAPGARHMTEVNAPGSVSNLWTHIVNGPNGVGYARRYSNSGTCHHRRAADAGGVTLFTGSYSIEAWVRPEVLGGTIFGYCGTTGNETLAENFLGGLFVQANGRLQSFWEQGALGTDVTTNQSVGTAMVVGTWYHVAITVDYSGGTASVNFYVNGALQQTVTGLTKATGGTAATYNIGGSGASAGVSTQFQGAIKSVRLSSKVRSGSEITASASATDYQHVLDADTFALWQLNDPPDARDETSYGYHLRKVSGALGIAPPLVIDGGQSRFLETATEYAAHHAYEPMRNMFANLDWTFDCWFKMSTAYGGTQRGFWVHGDPGPEDLASNFVSLDLLTDRTLFITQERTNSAINDSSNSFGQSRPLLGTVDDGYTRHYLVVLRYFSGGVWNWEIWLDAALVYTTTLPLGYDGGTLAWLRVSSGNTLGSNTFFGTMDNARWTKRRATAAEIAGAYLEGIAETANCLVVTPVSPLTTPSPLDGGDPDDQQALNTWIIFDVTDPQAMGALGGSNKPYEVTVTYGNGAEITIWNGTSFHADFLGSHRDEILGGHEVFIRPASGAWPSTSVEIQVKEL